MAKINVISYDDYVGKGSTTSSSSTSSTKTSGKVISYDDYIGKSPLQSPKQQVENQAKQNYESATKAYNSVLDAKKNIVKNEYNKLGNQAPQSQLKFSTTPSSTFVRNADGTTTIKSQYEKNQEAIQENQKKQSQLINNIRNNADYQALSALETPLNNQRLLAKYNYDVAKEDNRNLTLLDKTLGVPYRAALDFFNVDKLTTNSAYVDENNNKMYLPADYQIRQENVRNSYDDTLLGKAARFGTDLGYNLTKIGLSSAINTLTAGFAPVGSMMYFEDMGIDSFNQAKLDGYDDTSAALYGVVNVASEMVTEKFLGGLSKHLKITKGDSALSSGINKALSKVMKNDKLRSVLSNAFSEGAEEFVQEFIENYNKKLVLEKKNLGQATEETLLNSNVWEDALYSTLLGMASGGALATVSSPAINTNNTGVIPNVDKSGNIDIKTYISQLNKARDNTSNQAKIDNINQTLNYLQLNETLGNEKVNVQTLNQEIKNLTPVLEQVSDILPNETNINNEVNTNVETNVNDNINTNNIENNIFDDTEAYRNFGKALENDTLPGNGNEVVLPKASDNVSQITNNVGSEQRLQVAPTSNVKVNNLYNSASQYLNNSEESLNLVNTMAKVVKDKGYNILFSDEGMNTKNGIINGKIETKNGETTITLNPYSPRAYEFVLVHEITHAIETNSLKSMIMDYAQKNSEFNAALDSLKKIYKTNEITSEVAADISGQLLGNQEFINQLSMAKPNLFMHIYNEIKALYHKLRGWKSENEFIEDLMNKWEYAYATRNNNVSNKNSVQETETVKNTKQNKQMLEQEFKKLTGDSLLVAEAKLGNYAFRQIQKENGNYKGEVKAPYSAEAMKLYNQIQNSKQTSSYLYHSTPADRIGNIIENGLQVGSKQNQEGVSSKDKIYLSATEELAKSFTPDDSVTLRISPNAKLDNLDYDLLGGEGSYSITNNIDPKYLQVKENNKWVNLLKSDLAKNIQQTNTISKVDNQGRTLSKQQQNYFKNSKVRDDNGNLKEVYHGTNYDFTVFKNPTNNHDGKASGALFENSTISMFTDSQEVAQTYIDTDATPNKQAMKVYLNMTNPYIVDANYQYNTYFYDNDGKPTNVNNLVKKIYDSGQYDGVIIKNVADLGYFGDHDVTDGRQYATDYITFNSNQIKNVDNTNPTTNNDIRYSKNAAEWQEYLKKEYDTRGTITLNKDNNGRKLSKQQQDYFKDSKIRDNNGNLLTVYHTMTDEGTQFNEFNPVGTPNYKFGNQVVNFYTNSKTMSESYADYDYKMANTKTTKLNSIQEANNYITNFNKNNNDSFQIVKDTTTKDGYMLMRGNATYQEYISKNILLRSVVDDINNITGEKAKYQYEGYLDIKNPYIVDAKEANWDNILSGYDDIAVRYANEINTDIKNQLSELAHESKNLAEKTSNDWWEKTKELGKLKLDGIDTDATVDELQKSKKGTDTEYRKLVDRAIKLKNEIAELEKLPYRYEDSYFKENVTNIMNNLNEEQNMNYSEYELYKMAINDFTDESLIDTYGTKMTTNEIIQKVLKENEHNKVKYDGVIIKKVMDYGSTTQFDDTGAAQDVYVTFNSNQFKAADNTNPTTDADIRYSKQNQNWQDYVENNFKNEGTTTKYSISEKTGKLQDSNGKDVKLETSNVGDTGSLMAIHNLSTEKLQGILELGGFPVPSIAITTTDNTGSNQFGNISVLFDKTTIDPANKLNEVYDRDVWTPTFPRVEYDIDNQKIRTMSKANNFYDNTDDGIVNHARLNYMYSENLSDLVNRNGISDALKQMKNDAELKYLYLKTKDNNYQPQLKRQNYSDTYTNETLQKFVDNFSWKDMSLADFYYHYLNYGDMNLTDDQTKALKATVRDTILPEIRQEAKEEYNRLSKLNKTGDLSEQKFVDNYTDMMLESFDESYFKYKDFIRDASRLSEFGETQTIDEDATLKQVEKDVNQKQYDKWIDDTFGKMLNETKKGIRNDKDIFTSSGNRRNFNQLHENYDLQNIVKFMTSQKTVAGEEGFGAGSGFGTIQAQMSNKFDSIDDIRNSAKERITTYKEGNDFLKPYSDAIYNDMEQLVEYYKYKDSKYNYPMDTAGYVLNEFAGYKKNDINNLKKVLTEYDFETSKIPNEILTKTVDDINSLRNIPTDYFEAKPQRAVGLDEIQQIVLPNTTDVALKQELQKRGINYTEYDPKIEGDKQRVINQFDNLKFSKNNKTWQQYLEENYVSRGTRTFGKDVLYKDNTQNKASDTYSIKNVLDTTQDTTTNTPITKGNDVLRAENNIDNSNLTKAEINELNTLEAVYDGGFSTAQEEARLEYLKNKRDGLIKYAELKQKVEFKDISKEYTKYKNDLGNFDPTLLNEAESNVKGYRNTKTKAQWLDIAEQIGANFKGNGQELTNYALQSWFEAQPNNKKSLNREGKGYVKFSVDEWVNAVYKGAGVGDKVTRTSTAPAVKTTKVENDYNTYTQAEINNMFQFSDDDGHKIALPDDVGERLATKTTLTPIEVGNLQNIIDSAYQINVNGNSLEIVGDYDNTIYTVKATKQGDTFVIDDMVKGTKNPLGSVANIETTTNDEVESIDNKKSKMENGQTIGEVINNIREQATKPTNQRTEYEETVEKGTNLKESNFYKNATETSQFITEDNRTKLSEVGDLKYYEGITNEDSLNKASKRLKDYGTNEAIRWMQQDNKTSSATDVAEGWILLKNYQDAGDYDSMVAVAKKMRQMGTIAGQTIQAYNIMARLTPEGMVKYAQSELSEAFDIYAKNKSKTWLDKNASKFDLNTQEVEFIVDTMKQVESMEDGRAKNIKLGEINKMLTEKLPPERGSGIKAWMRISMLFNPKTQIRNVMGNVVITPVNLVGDYFASVADKFIARKTGVRTTGTTDIKSYVKGFKKGLYESYDDFKRGINTRNIDANRFELGQAKSFNQNNTLGKALNKVDAINSFLLDAGDRGFYEASFTNSINNQLALNNTTKVTQDMIDIATSEALSRTWQDNNNYTKFVLSTRNMLNKVNVKGYGLGDVLIPFAKTPANLTKAIVDYSPAGLVNTIIQAKNLKNNISTGMNTAQQQHQFVQTLGKATAGTLLYVAAYGLAKAGIATGKSDDDKDTRDFLKNTLGVSSYSIKIGNKSFTYDWAQPVAAPLSIMTNIVNSKNNKGQALLEAVTSSLDSAGSILLEQSFVKSINEVLTDNDGIVSGLENAILDLPARAIPTFSKQIVDMTDSTQRQTFEYGQPLKTAVNKLKAKIPGVSYTLAPSVDSLGREIQKYGGKNNIFNVFLNPANVNTSNISDAAKEIYNVYKETGDNTIMPRVAPYYINSKGEKTILNTEQRKDFQKIAGNIIENSVNELKKNSNYKAMNYEDKSTTIKNIIDYAYNKARKDVLGMDMSNTYNKVNEWLDKGGKISDYYANKEEVNYSLQNPTKYNAIKGMSIDYDDYKTYQAKVNEIKNKYSGTKNANLRKQKVAEYINSLSLSANKKIMLFKMLGNYSIKNYSGTIKNYINNFDLTSSEKQEIYNSLF